jgi:hypothetical protein
LGLCARYGRLPRFLARQHEFADVCRHLPTFAHISRRMAALCRYPGLPPLVSRNPMLIANPLAFPPVFAFARASLKSREEVPIGARRPFPHGRIVRYGFFGRFCGWIAVWMPRFGGGGPMPLAAAFGRGACSGRLGKASGMAGNTRPEAPNGRGLSHGPRERGAWERPHCWSLACFVGLLRWLASL